MNSEAIDFYVGRDHVVTFLGKFDQAFPNRLEEDLSLVKKFQLYLEKFPDYDCWDRARYIEFKSKSDKGDPAHVVDLGITYISMRGNICQMQGYNSGLVRREHKLDTAGYHCISIFSRNIRLHRIMCCTFVKKPDKSIPLHLLQANHIDGVKTNHDVTNLEWVTPQGNVLHALRTRLRASKVFRMTIYRAIKHYPVGTTFYIRRKDIIEIGFKQKPISLAADPSNKNRAYSSEWVVVPHEEGMVFGIPLDLVKQDFITKPR